MSTFAQGDVWLRDNPVRLTSSYVQAASIENYGEPWGSACVQLRRDLPSLDYGTAGNPARQGLRRASNEGILRAFRNADRFPTLEIFASFGSSFWRERNQASCSFESF